MVKSSNGKKLRILQIVGSRIEGLGKVVYCFFAKKHINVVCRACRNFGTTTVGLFGGSREPLKFMLDPVTFPRELHLICAHHDQIGKTFMKVLYSSLHIRFPWNTDKSKESRGHDQSNKYISCQSRLWHRSSGFALPSHQRRPPT